MKPVLIVENSTSSLIRESASTNKEYVLGGTFTEFGVKNRNERIYQAEKFLPALQEMNERMSSLGVVYGEFDHPDVFDTSLSRASHIITKAEFVAEKNIVAGEIKLLSTYWGKEAKSLVDDGCPVFVSSRAAGITESDGSVSLKKLFTYDIVADPGFASAKMSVRVLNESLGFCPEGQIEKNNFRIYELSDESKINELFNMNKDEFVTKKQLSDYSQYLVKEIASTKSEVKSAISKGNMSPQKLEQLLEYYEELNNTNSQVAKYLDYLADKIQVVVNENKSLKDTTDKLAKHNDYLAENLEKAIAYSEYVAENLDKSISYQGMIVERLNGSKLNENFGSEESFPSLDAAGFEVVENEKEEECGPMNQEEVMNGIAPAHEEEAYDKEEEEAHTEEEIMNGIAPAHEEEAYNKEENEEKEEEKEEEVYMNNMNSESELSESINKLIEEAKKRKVSETTDLNFLKFLNKSQVDSFYALSDEEQETVKFHINERSYFTQKEVLTLIAEALSTKNESLEERVIRLMPENIKPIWEQLNESSKKSALSQARLYPEDVLKTENQIEHFWLTRNFKKNESVTKKLVAHESLIQEDKLSDKEVTAIMERFKNI